MTSLIDGSNATTNWFILLSLMIKFIAATVEQEMTIPCSINAKYLELFLKQSPPTIKMP